MKILIADDCPERYGRLEERIEKVFGNADMITYANCARQAIQRLTETTFDLFILDVLLPDRETQMGESSNYSMDLLNELGQETELFRPNHIIGITGDPEAYQDNSHYFSEMTWTIVHYEQSSDDWLDRIFNCVEYIEKHKQSSQKCPIEYDYDLVIVCALDVPELSEVKKLSWQWKPPKPIDTMTFISEGTFECDGRKFRVAATSLDRMGMVEAALTTAKLIEKLRPKCIAMTGICAGVSGKVSLGDVLFADPVWDYQCGKLGKNEEGTIFLQIEPHQIQADPGIRSLAKQAVTTETMKSIFTSYPETNSVPLPVFRVGPVGTGSAVLADGQKIHEIVEQNRKLLGIEMEIYGVYAASQKSELRPKAFAVKSVCDYASPDKGDNLQKYSSYMSANVLREIMEKYGSKILS